MQAHEEPTFDGNEATDPNPAVKDADATESETRPSEEDTAPGEVARVRYTGTANVRSLSASDLAGMPVDNDIALVWTPGSEQPLSWFVELAGSVERARDVLRAQSHEFELLGSDPLDVPEEFSVGGEVGE